MNDKDFIQNNYINMWKLNGNGLKDLIQDVANLTTEPAINQWVQKIGEDRILSKKTDDITLLDMFKFQLINNIIEYGDDIDVLLHTVQGTLHEFFAQLKGLEEYTDEFDKEYVKYMMQF